MTDKAEPTPPDRRSLYRAVWRWHFYAGLVVLPFLLWLAVTGGLYLYKPEIEAVVYKRWSQVPADTRPIALDHMVAEVERQSGDKVVQIVKPDAAGTSWRMTLAAPPGVRTLGFIDPGDGRLLGVTSDGGVMQTIRDLHSLIITGPVGNALIEAVAGWAIILALSGLYLWWPRAGSPVIGARGRPSGRLFWRDLHASTGALAAAVILFLALTGMPWTGTWGKTLQTIVASQGLGRPKSPGPSPWEAAKGHGQHAPARDSLPWSLQEQAMPMAHGQDHIGPAQVAAEAEMRGMAGGWTMTLPSVADAPYVVSAVTVRAQDARALYIDGGTGAILQDSAYAGFGAGARTIEWGIATHQGQQYGEVNRLVMLAGCLSIAMLALTAPMLWWKRRRDRRLSAPPRPDDRRRSRQILVIMIGVGALFPLTGLSMLAALIVERLWRLTRKPAPHA